jgi:1-acyl-sn-glycerol-3-phosphate acyltransferase
MISRLFVWLCVRWFRSSGWKIEKPFPALRKYVLIVAPHTSNVDFPIGVAARNILNINARYVAKKELFIFPIRNLLINLGGYPVDRSKKNSFVDNVVELFNKIENFAICVTPEGTRSKVDEWKTGFYHMALRAKVPIVPVGFDYSTKTVMIGAPLDASGDIKSDFEKLHLYFSKIRAKHPGKSMYGV